MIESTPEDRRAIVEEVNGRKSKSGRTTYPQWIETTDELVEQYHTYAYRDLLHRMDYDNLDEDKQRTARMAASMYADLSADRLKHDMPALIFLFRRYLTQR